MISKMNLGHIINIEEMILSISPFPFCLLTLFVLVYYVRRRYKLYREIKRFPREMLFKESYQNYFKNLKIKCIINNFIIVILVLELVQNMGEVVYILFDWFLVETLSIKIEKFVSLIPYPFLSTVQNNTYLFIFPIRFIIVPLLSLLMNVLWLIYRKFEYKHTIIRWVWYLAIRTFVFFVTNYLLHHQYHTRLFVDRSILLFLNSFYLFERIILLFDFIQFVHFSRKFYLHLKSKENEIRLFYYDEKAYLNSKYLRIHFKTATILVGIAIFFFSIGGFILTNGPGNFGLLCNASTQYWCDRILYFWSSATVYIFHPSLILYKIMITFNYLYVFIVVVYKSYNDRKKLANINIYIKPIVKKYHKSLYYSLNIHNYHYHSKG